MVATIVIVGREKKPNRIISYSVIYVQLSEEKKWKTKKG